VSAGEERKLVTVLFADLVGSTAYAGERDPERVRAHLERFYDAMREEIELTGGTVEKFAGLRRTCCARGPRGEGSARSARDAAPLGRAL
jgi:class 3 adenylate cyclase